MNKIKSLDHNFIGEIYDFENIRTVFCYVSLGTANKTFKPKYISTYRRSHS